jgi:DnaJ domain
MKDYYHILGVSRGADIDHIKKAFRRLAIAYHPDRNPSKEAEVFIKEIIEAYEVLEDPIRRNEYDALLGGRESFVPVTPVKPHRDPRYRRRPPDPTYKSEKQETLEMMQRYMPYAVAASWCTLVFMILLAADFFWTPVHESEVVRAITPGHYRESSERILTQKGNEFKVSRADLAKIKGGESITVFYSPWLKVPKRFTKDQSRETVRIPATIYGNFIFGPLLLLLSSLTGVGYRKGVMFRFNLGIVNFLLLGFNLLLLFVHRLHLT